MTMRVRKVLTAGALAVGLAAAAGIGAPAAQAAQADSKSVSASAATASGGFLTCSDPTSLSNEPNSKATACLSVYDGQVTAFSSVTFTSPSPWLWTSCGVMADLYKVASDGTETFVGIAEMDCKLAATTSQSVAINFSAPAETGKTYRAKMGMISQYNGSVVYGHPVATAKVTVLA
jgi:hypothetical protein